MPLRTRLALGVIALMLSQAGTAAQKPCMGIGPMTFSGDDPPPALRLAKVRETVKQLHFVHGDWGGDSTGCPDQGENCKLSAYVVGGDEVLINSTEQGYACIVFTDPRTGWATDSAYLPSKMLVPLVADPLDSADWSGRWRHVLQERPERHGEQARIDIRALGDGRNAIHGSAAPDDRDSVRTARMILTGEFQAIAEPQGTQMAFAIDTDGSTVAFHARPDDSGNSICRVRLQRLGSYLIVQDNDKCSDGIWFSGAYRRAP